MKYLVWLLLIITPIMYAQSQHQKSPSTDYIHQLPVSFKSQFLQTLMAIVGKKKSLERAMKHQRFASEAASIPAKLFVDSAVEEIGVGERRAWLVTPKREAAKRVILYIHGGGYISNMTKYDWSFVRELGVRTNSSIVVADYPLAPVSNYKHVYAYFDELYRNMLTQIANDDIIFLGNSAGGGIALGFAQKLRDENRPLPSKIILNSPWLDVSMSNPEIVDIDKKDKSLGIEGLRMAGKAYAADLSTNDPRVSPIYGEFSGLPPIHLFIGTHDLFLPDARKLKQQLMALDIRMNYYEYPRMFHVWVAVTSLRESRHAISQMAEIINSN